MHLFGCHALLFGLADLKRAPLEHRTVELVNAVATVALIRELDEGKTFWTPRVKVQRHVAVAHFAEVGALLLYEL